MSVIEKNALIRAKDVTGDSFLIYPITKAENVDGLDEMLVQSDWSQNDETQPDYIKNRTHYDSVTEVVVFDGVGTYSADASGDGEVVYFFDSTADLNLELNYKVYLNGELYNREFSYFDEAGDCLFIALTDEQDDVAAMLIPEGVAFTDLTYSTLGDSPTIKVCTTIEDLHPLDEKYIPDSIARTSAVTAVSTELDEKIASASTASENKIANVNTALENKIANVNTALEKKSAVQFNSNFLSTLNIHKISQEEYDQAVIDGTIDEDAVYLTPDSAVQFITWEEDD